jgi:hypothetical protein
LLVRAITRILSTDIAEETYAQIIDGLPISDVAFDRRVQFHKHHPILHQAHEELCPGMLDKAREFRDGFRPDILTFDSQVRRTQHIGPFSLLFAKIWLIKIHDGSYSMNIALARRVRGGSRLA